MTLKDVFEEQRDFQKYFFDPDNLSAEEKIKFTKENILSVHRELGEILDTIPWKLHRKEDKSKSEHNTIEEIIDAFKFLLNLCVIWGIDDEMFIKEFFRKSSVVRQRYYQEVLNAIKDIDKVCALDLDDVLAEHSKYFVETYNTMYETNFKYRYEIKEALSYSEYEDFKKYFRESGLKTNIPVKQNAKELCKTLKEQGYKIVIISARPYEQFLRIFPDTLEWLKNNSIEFDAIYFEKEKHIKILKQLPNISFIIEDNPMYAKQISDLGYKVFLLSNMNEEESETKLRETLDGKNITNVDSLSQIMFILEETRNDNKRTQN